MTSREKEMQAQIEELQKTIGKLQLLNRELKQQATQSDAANKAKSDFLAMISHEIRTPLNGVIGLTEILLDTKLDSKQRHYSNLVLTSARNLLTLINSLLDFSKIEADKMELDIGEFDLRKLVDELIKLYSLTGQGKNLGVYAEIDPRLSGCYLGDSYRIRQILVNLLGNAIKFADRGSVVLRVTGSKTDARQEVVRFEVEDTGPGIPAHKTDQLFIPFSQIDNSTTRRHGGTGLGLAICQKLVSLMDGEIGFESTEGKGSRFWFTLPLRLAGSEPAKKAQPRPEPPQYDCRHESERRGPGRSPALTSILIVDDDETNRFVLETILQNTSTHILTVENGREAVRLCENRDFDLIFMDCRMPVMDGFDATAAIRSLTAGKSRKHPVIIALTADATQDTRQHCSAVGMDDCLLKPLDFDRLQHVFDNWLPDAGIHIHTRPHTLPAAAGKSEPKTKPAGSQPIDDKVLAELQENIGDIQPVIRVFLHSLQGRLEQLQQAIAEGESAVVSRVAHTIKGSCSQFGATHLAELCRLAETMGNNKNMANMEILLKKIKQAAEQVAIFLREKLDER
ncbi:BarA sensory histidine kinase (= VarS = GacS) [hydrothermal vent metagenome]|uniref:histidine kinase n=1 Tax=hydrothermal vent metagenome TaxID=652676 RepID=A0A3B0VF11_9ZZZZ